jgi:cysteine desulfurase/selenocysteine lyase
LLEYCIEKSKSVDGLKRIGCAQNSASVFSFVVEGTHPSDIGMLLDQEGIAVRTGHHCTQPLMKYFDTPGSVRASLSIYNTLEEIDTFFSALESALKLLR